MPNHERAAGNKRYYEAYVEANLRSQKRGDDGDVKKTTDEDVNYKKPEDYDVPEREAYEKLCREALPKVPAPSLQLIFLQIYAVKISFFPHVV